MSTGDPSEAITIYTIGHSNHTAEKFLDLLRQHSIQSLVDVRSAPYSKYATHFNRGDLEYAIERAGIRYTFLGEELGGRPPTDDFYDADGHALYYKMATAPYFLRGIEKLEEEGGTYPTAFMCAEENPEGCHRHLLIARVLSGRGVNVIHIHGNGKTISEEELALHTRQPRLWGEDETEWKSLLPVSHRRPQRSSSSPSDEWE